MLFWNIRRFAAIQRKILKIVYFLYELLRIHEPVRECDVILACMNMCVRVTYERDKNRTKKNRIHIVCSHILPLSIHTLSLEISFSISRYGHAQHFASLSFCRFSYIRVFELSTFFSLFRCICMQKCFLYSPWLYTSNTHYSWLDSIACENSISLYFQFIHDHYLAYVVCVCVCVCTRIMTITLLIGC